MNDENQSNTDGGEQAAPAVKVPGVAPGWLVQDSVQVANHAHELAGEVGSVLRVLQGNEAGQVQVSFAELGQVHMLDAADLRKL
jgi:hypothetical protein